MAASPDIVERKPQVRIGEAPVEPRNHAITAALVGGAAAAAAGAVWGARAWAQRKAEGDGRQLNAVMKNAVTASEVSHPHEGSYRRGGSGSDGA